MSRDLESRIQRLEQAAGTGRRVLLAIWGEQTPAEIRARIRAKAEAEAVAFESVDVLCVDWLEGRAL